MTAGARCGGCDHVAHRNACRGKAASGCVPMEDPPGFLCYRGQRPPCPCAWRTCRCGAEVVVAALLTDRGIEVPVLRGGGGRGGLIAVRPAADGSLVCVELPAGEPLPAGPWWRGVEHDGPCQELHGPGWGA